MAASTGDPIDFPGNVRRIRGSEKYVNPGQFRRLRRAFEDGILPEFGDFFGRLSAGDFQGSLYRPRTDHIDPDSLVHNLFGQGDPESGHGKFRSRVIQQVLLGLKYCEEEVRMMHDPSGICGIAVLAMMMGANTFTANVW